MAELLKEFETRRPLCFEEPREKERNAAGVRFASLARTPESSSFSACPHVDGLQFSFPAEELAD